MKTAVFALAFLAVVVCVVTSRLDCPCPRIMDPVCDTEGNKHNNPCTLRCKGKTEDDNRHYDSQNDVCVLIIPY